MVKKIPARPVLVIGLNEIPVLSQGLLGSSQSSKEGSSVMLTSFYGIRTRIAEVGFWGLSQERGRCIETRQNDWRYIQSVFNTCMADILDICRTMYMFNMLEVYGIYTWNICNMYR